MGGSIGEHVWRQSYKMSTSQVTFGANLIKCQHLMSTSTVILARILQSVNFSIYRYILGNTNTVVCSDIGNTNTSIHPVSYCPIWDEAVLIPSLSQEFARTVRSSSKVSNPLFQPLIGSQEPTPLVLVPGINLPYQICFESHFTRTARSWHTLAGTSDLSDRQSADLTLTRGV